MFHVQKFLTLACILVLHSSVHVVEAKQKGQSIRIDDTSQIWIFDNILRRDKLDGLNDYVSSVHIDFTQQDIEGALEKGVTPFHSKLNVTDIKKLKFFSTVRSLVEEAVGKETHLIDVHGEFLHSLDPKPPIREDCNENTYHVAIFLNQFWQYNSYGQISFYSDVEQDGKLETVYTVHPKPARMVIWPSCVINAAHPPAVNYFSNIHVLKMTFSAEKDEKQDDSNNDGHVDTPKIQFGDFTFTNADADRTIDHAKHLKRTFYDSRKRGIHVFDDLFTTEELRQFRQHLLDTGHPRLSQYDGGPMEDHDNVQWIASYNVSEFTRTSMWTRVKVLLVFLTKEDGWHPYDVAMNYVRPADHTRIHPDAEGHQYEYTYLLYLSENITQDDFGETMFFEQRTKKSDGIHQFTNPGGEEFEPIAAVWPKFGRLVIFRNVIEHSARPLSSAHLGCRYSFAVKSARTQRHAFIKQLYESMEGFGELNGQQQKLNQQLSTGRHDDPKRSKLTTEALGNKLRQTQDAVLNFHNSQRDMILKMLQ